LEAILPHAEILDSDMLSHIYIDNSSTRLDRSTILKETGIWLGSEDSEEKTLRLAVTNDQVKI
jgi:hypothetical protein